MAYLVKALKKAAGELTPDKEIYWEVNQVEWVEDACIPYYLYHSDKFTVIDGPLFTELARVLDISPGAMAAAYIDFNGAAESGMTITIDSVVYTEADTAVPASGVFTNGASAADSATSLIAALNGDTRATVPFTAVADVSGDGVWLFWDAVGDDGNVTITTDSSSNCTIQNSLGGAASAVQKDRLDVLHTVNTQELLSGAIEIPVPFTPTGFQITAVSSTGAPIYFTDLVTIESSPARIRITTDGATNLANANIIHLTVFE